MKEDAQDLISLLNLNTSYEFIVSRLGKVERFEVVPTGSRRSLKEITIRDRKLAEKAFGFAESKTVRDLA
jgi:hypothetical protein